MNLRRVFLTKQRAWAAFLGLSLIAGILLRVLFVEDMEYKEDEEYNFTQTQLIGNTQPWPWYGIPSGVYLVNPGMSIWVFTVLAKLFRITQPTDLAHAVQLFAILGMSLLLPMALLFLRTQKERRDWQWAFALAMVNPFLVFYQRKLWPEPFLPFFTVLTLAGWWKRHTIAGALVWGLIGAILGQIHMSGFFLAFALFVWTVLFKRTDTRWGSWFVGSTLGALPLIPWLKYVLEHPIQEKMSAGWEEIIQLKYWAFWLTNPVGLHLGNPLGLLRGQSNFEQISDFIRYPIWNGTPTYLVGVAHAVLLGTAIVIAIGALTLRFKRKTALPNAEPQSDSQFVIQSAFIGSGVLMTLTGVVIRRYYMAVTFPLEFLFFIRLAKPETRPGRALLATVWICQLVISTGFVHYIHVNEGSTQGDYGEAYHVIQAKKKKQTGSP